MENAEEHDETSEEKSDRSVEFRHERVREKRATRDGVLIHISTKKEESREKREETDEDEGESDADRMKMVDETTKTDHDLKK
jgi:hypothetical protein